MSESNKSFYVVLIGLIVISLGLMIVGVWQEPRCEAYEVAKNQDQEDGSQRPIYSRSVTCYADCQVHFGAENTGAVDARTSAEGKSNVTRHNALPPVEERDLCQQARMSWWTRIIAYFTALGAGLLFWTIMITRKEIEENRASFIKQLALEHRAWLVPITPTMERWQSTDRPIDEQLFFVFNIQFSNAGKTPALDVTSCSGHKIIAVDDEIPSSFELFSDERLPHKSTIPQDIVFSGSNKINITYKEMAEIADRKKRLVLWAYVKYRTVVDDDVKESACCFEVTTNATSQNLKNPELPRAYLNFIAAGDFNYTK